MSQPAHMIRSDKEIHHLRSLIERLQREGMDQRDIEAVIRQVSNEKIVRPYHVWARLVPFAWRSKV
jgi:hypothetical protein